MTPSPQSSAVADDMFTEVQGGPLDPPNLSLSVNESVNDWSIELSSASEGSDSDVAKPEVEPDDSMDTPPSPTF
jgi:hypothetical protein